MKDLLTVQDSLTVARTAGTKDIIERYLYSLDVKPRSKDAYRKALKQFLSFIETRGTTPQRADILAYKEHLLKNYSACTVSAYLSAVRSFYKYLESEKITPNIAGSIKGAKSQGNFRKDALTIEQAKGVLDSIDANTLEGKRNYALINLLIRTGLRTVEVERANVGDLRQQGGQAVLYVQGKGRDEKDAFVILTESSLRPIREYLRSRGKPDDQAPLFASQSDRNQGGRLTTRSISRIVKDALVAAGIDSERITAHSLRHTAVTFALLGGATIQEAQGMARHKSINTTMIYAHNIDRLKKAAEHKIDQLLSS